MEENYITISFAGLWAVIKKNWLALIGITAVFIAGGLYYAMGLKDEFTSNGKILPEIKGGGGRSSGLSGLASLAGVSIPSAEGSDAIRPDLYPDVLNSVPFYLYLLDKQIITEGNKKQNFKQYALKALFKGDSSAFAKKQAILPMGDGSIGLSHVNFGIISELRKRVTAVMDKKTGIITVSAKMPDRYVATSIAGFSLTYLTDYITKYRTQKAADNVLFFEEQMKRAKSKFYSTQAQKAQYQDGFQQQYMRMRSMDVQRERIETEYMFSSAFYKQLEQQYEQSKIDLQREIPVLKVLEPPIIPNEKSEPKRSIILIGISILGAIVALIAVLLWKKNWKNVIISSES
jgi:Chain length determinant protein